MTPIRPGKDFYAGLLYILFGALAVFIGRGYPLGTSARMGPGYFPVLIGALLVLVGILVGARGLRSSSERIAKLSFKPLLFTLGAVLLFAVLIERAGLAIALLAVIVVGYLGNARWRLGELTVLAAILSTASVLVFYYALKLPFKIWPDWF